MVKLDKKGILKVALITVVGVSAIALMFMLILTSKTVVAYTENTTAFFCGNSTMTAEEICDDCENALNNNTYNIVYLNATVIGAPYSCINNPTNFSNKVFDCQGNTIQGSGTRGILMSSQANNTVRNCRIFDYYYGIQLTASTNNTITNNTLGGGTNGILLDTDSDNNTINNNTAYILGNSGIRLNGADNNTVTYNTVYNSSTNCIRLAAAGVTFNNVTYNTVYNCTTTGFKLTGASNNILAYNTAYHNGGIRNNIRGYDQTYNYNRGGGIDLRETSPNNNITNNTLYGSDYGVVFVTSTNNNLTNNNLSFNEQFAADELGDAGCNYVDASNYAGDEAKPINYTRDATGIVVQNTAAYSEITFCNVNNSVIDNVTISNTGTHGGGIKITYSNNNTINNSKSINGYVGAYLYFSSYNNLTNNNFTNNSAYSVFDSYPPHCNYIDLNNTGGDGKPIKYVCGESTTIQNTADYSEIILINSDNSVIDNVTISNPISRSDGIYTLYSDNVNITSSAVTYGTYGIALYFQSNNRIESNTLNYNDYGLVLAVGSGDNITSNTINNNTVYGIHLYGESGANITSNEVCDNLDRDMAILTGTSGNFGTGNTCDNTSLGTNIINCTATCASRVTASASGSSATTTTTGGGSYKKSSDTNIIIKPGETGAFSFGGSLAIRAIKLTAKEEILSSKITIEWISEDKVTEKIIGPAYHYEEVTSSQFDNSHLDESQIEDVILSFRVRDDWMDEYNVGANTVVLKRYVNGKWVNLETEIVGSDGRYHYFEAKSPGLSYFAIGNLVSELEEKENREAQKQFEEIPILPWPWIVVIILAVIVAGAYSVKRRG